jgi:hypothetical protein
MTFVPAVEVLATQAEIVELPDLSRSALLERFPGLGSAHAVCLTGSIEAGWGNIYSDVDIIAFSDQEVPLPLDDTAELWPGSDPCGVDWVRWVGTYRDVCVDIKVVATDAVDIALRPFLDGAEPELCTIGLAMEDFVYRVWIGRALSGQEFFDAQRATIAGSSYRRALARYLKIDAENALTDAAGQLASGDCRTARLSAMKAAGLIVDSALVIAGELCRGQKWLLRRLESTPTCGITADEYLSEVLEGRRPGESDAECAARIARWAQAHLVRIEDQVLSTAS